MTSEEAVEAVDAGDAALQQTAPQQMSSGRKLPPIRLPVNGRTALTRPELLIPPEPSPQGDWPVMAMRLPEWIDDELLIALFKPYGVLNSVRLIKDEQGKSRNFGYVNFADPKEAVKAIKALDGHVLGDETRAMMIVFKRKGMGNQARFGGQFPGVTGAFGAARGPPRGGPVSPYGRPPPQHGYGPPAPHMDHYLMESPQPDYYAADPYWQGPPAHYPPGPYGPPPSQQHWGGPPAGHWGGPPADAFVERWGPPPAPAGTWAQPPPAAAGPPPGPYYPPPAGPGPYPKNEGQQHQQPPPPPPSADQGPPPQQKYQPPPPAPYETTSRAPIQQPPPPQQPQAVAAAYEHQQQAAAQKQASPDAFPAAPYRQSGYGQPQQQQQQAAYGAGGGAYGGGHEPYQPSQAGPNQEQPFDPHALPPNLEPHLVPPAPVHGAYGIVAKGLPQAMDDEGLMALFSTYGRVASVKVMRDEHGLSRNLGFVNMPIANEAIVAIRSLDGWPLAGRPLRIHFKLPSLRQG